MEDFEETDQILRSGDLGLIAWLDGETIRDYFGEDSFEYLAHQHLPAERAQQGAYRIPRRTESPAATAMGARSWIRDFHWLNRMPLPKGFHQRDKSRLVGMYYGMLNTYN